ncbi:hypothetical protein [Nonomuraea soli]|uniref:Uncharacterized protein n=1 Tax=Nonomuraea soli TaxID=1032476 RepID=A0A7W0CL70_9ACTN|nr:hypothetical protein [Nonomuraea soli]MBA2893099.1 hypothetical protein [Nonomuraea soli]
MFPDIEYLAIKGHIEELHREAADERRARQAGRSRHRWAPKRPKNT